MNQYEERAQKQRRTALRSSMTMGTAGVALVVVVLLIVGLSSSAPPRFFTQAAIAAAILLLILRQVSRRMKHRTPKAAEPDPKSRLNLD
jgi:ABC-type cobalamin transport system permease subunit